MKLALPPLVLIFFTILTFSRVNASPFEDLKFGFRIFLSDNWSLEQNNDSNYYFKDTNQEKKTRLQLKKYVLDTSYNFDIQEWSQLSLAINKEIAVKTGKIIFSNTGSSVKLGEFQAYELFAYFSQSVDNDIVWWAAYSRWTDTGGFGYLVSIIGDTTELKSNYNLYKSILDQIEILPLITAINHQRVNHTHTPVHFIAKQKWFDLMGRTIITKSPEQSGLFINKSRSQRRIQFN